MRVYNAYFALKFIKAYNNCPSISIKNWSHKKYMNFFITNKAFILAKAIKDI